MNYFETDEFSPAEKFFIKAINELGDHSKGKAIVDESTHINEESTENSESLVTYNERICNDTTVPRDPLYTPFFSESYNYLGIIWSNRSDFHRALTFLCRSEDIYKFYKESLDTHVKEKVGQRMENSFTLTAFYLAQVFGHFKDEIQSTNYCYLTLKRQLDSGLEFNKLEWAENCLDMTEVFSEQKDYKSAIHFIKSAEYIVSKNGITTDREKEVLAKVCKAKGKYYSDKLEYCKNWIEQNEPERIQHGCILGPIPESNRQPVLIEKTNKELPTLYFDNVPIEHNETESYVARTFEEARELFREGKKAYETSLEYYVIDGFVSDHIAILQELSALYRNLIFFEENLDRKL